MADKWWENDIPAEEEAGEWWENDIPAEAEAVDFNLGTAIRNIPGSSLDLVKDTFNAVTNPIETAMAVTDLAGDAFNLGQRKVSEWTGSGEIPQGTYGDESSAQALGQFYSDRYGSTDGFKKAVMEDPAGVLADLAAIGSGGASLAARAPGTVGRIGGAVNNASKSVLRAPGRAGDAMVSAVARRLPDDMEYEMYAGAAKYKEKGNPSAVQRRQRVETALDEQIPLTKKGTDIIQERISMLGGQVDELIEAANQTGGTVPVSALFTRLNDLRRTRGGIRVGAKKDLARIDKLAGDFYNWVRENRKDGQMTVQDLQNFKRSAWNKVKWNQSRQKGKPVDRPYYENTGRRAKEMIEDAVPEVADLNRRQGNLLDMQDVHADAVERLGKRQAVPLSGWLGAGFGAGPGGMAGMATGGSPLLGAATGAAVGLGVAGLMSAGAQSRIALAIRRAKNGDNTLLERLPAPEIGYALQVLEESQNDNEGPLQIEIRDGVPK